VGWQKTGRFRIVHPPNLLELFILLSRADLSAENLLVRHQPPIHTRLGRKPPDGPRDARVTQAARS